MFRLSAKSTIELLLDNINKICFQNNVDHTHGFAHAQKIASYAFSAIIQSNTKYYQQYKQCQIISFNEEQYDIFFASLLHDLDDRKYFKSKNYQNARKCLKIADISQTRIQKIIKMIDIVSFSKNGDQIDPKLPSTYYIPRYSDRIEAIGIQGLLRCYQYAQSLNLKRPVFDENTPKPQTIEQLYKFSQGRNIQYKKTGSSKSVIDHFFDKLVHIQLPSQIKCPGMQKLYEDKHKQMINFVLKHAKQNYINYENELLQYCQKQKTIKTE